MVDSFIQLRACTWGLGPQGAPWREEAEEREDAMAIVWQPWLKWEESTSERRQEAGRGQQPSSRKLGTCIRREVSPCGCKRRLAGCYKRPNSMQSSSPQTKCSGAAVTAVRGWTVEPQTRNLTRETQPKWCVAMITKWRSIRAGAQRIMTVAQKWGSFSNDKTEILMIMWFDNMYFFKP